MNTQVAAPGRTQALVSTKSSQNLRNAPPRKEVFFKLDASSAKEVLLAGDFTGWEKTPIKLRKGERGDWCATVKLAPGQYHYKFVVDGEWQDDPRATARCPNPFGTCDSVLEIS